MDFGEFSDVSLDTNDSSNFKSCDSDSVSEVESSGVWTNSLSNSKYTTKVEGDYSQYDDFADIGSNASVSPNPAKDQLTQPTASSFEHKLTQSVSSTSESSPLADADNAAEPGAGRERVASECSSDSTIHSFATQLGTDSESLDDATEDSTHLTYHNLMKQNSRSSIDELLFELYDKHGGSRHSSVCSIDGSSTDCSSLSEYQMVKSDTEAEPPLYTFSSLQELNTPELKELILDLTNKVVQKNAQLVKCLRNRERHRNRTAKHCDMITAILQAWSSKSSSDAKMKFTIEPAGGQKNFEQWKDAVTSLVRRPIGLPSHFRSKIWLALATKYFESLQLNWNKVAQFAFNDKCNPDDDALGAQIVKDLHRTGCSSFSGVENEEDRVILQRVLLGYARWNKVTGYCQGFNILAAFILNVTNKNEVDALKVMVYLVDNMLPKEYFAHNLRALTVDMAVFRRYLSMKLPKLSAHLIKLQQEACDNFTGVNVEPPLTNVFTMQWFLTMFATCLPMPSVLKIWDCVMIDGSEILIRTALALWTKLAKRVIRTKSADEFYMVMGSLTRELMEGKIISGDELMRSIYNMAPIPLPMFAELREKYMYDITPFSAAINSASHKAVYSEEDGTDYIQELTRKQGSPSDKTYHSMDVTLLKRQYAKLTQRQRQARLLMKVPVTSRPPRIIPSSTSPIAINHLFVGKQLSEKSGVMSTPVGRAAEVIRSRSVDDYIKARTPSVSDTLSTKLDIHTAPAQRGHQQAIRYKHRKSSPPTSSATKTASREGSVDMDERLETVIENGIKDGGVVHRLGITDDDDTSEESVSTPGSPPSVSRQLSAVSISSNATTDSVFSPADGSVHQRNDVTATSNRASSGISEVQRVYRRTSSPARQETSPFRDFSSTTRKVFNPFPKPATGLLSAEKAKIGVKLGLYKPQDALTYMKPSERRQFLKDDKNFIGRMAMVSQSSIW